MTHFPGENLYQKERRLQPSTKAESLFSEPRTRPSAPTAATLRRAKLVGLIFVTLLFAKILIVAAVLQAAADAVKATKAKASTFSPKARGRIASPAGSLAEPSAPAAAAPALTEL